MIGTKGLQQIYRQEMVQLIVQVRKSCGSLNPHHGLRINFIANVRHFGESFHERLQTVIEKDKTQTGQRNARQKEDHSHPPISQNAAVATMASNFLLAHGVDIDDSTTRCPTHAFGSIIEFENAQHDGPEKHQGAKENGQVQ